jgi:hypothetical protein
LATIFRALLRSSPIAFGILLAALTGGRRVPLLPMSANALLVAEQAPNLRFATPFHLGTAARPFGWATAIADVNHDGLADTAAADRLSRVSAGYVYELRFSVSGLPPRSVWFESADTAITVTIRDVNHDSDLDIVVSEVLTRVVAKVWLNDGRGHFTEASPTQEPARLEPVQAIKNGGVADGFPLDSTAGVNPPTDLAFAELSPAATHRYRRIAPPRSMPSAAQFSALPPRAPPLLALRTA